MERVAFDGSQPGGAMGYFTYLVDEDWWTWSDGVYRLHGYAPREVVATTELILGHKHPDDRARALSVLEDVVRTGEPFSCYHRIIDRQERVRSIISVGRGVKDHDGRVRRVEGYFVDLTAARRDETEAEVQAALTRIAEHREAIDEAKGMVMVATGCDEAAAFACLRRYSQSANMKLHEVAHRLVDAVGPDRHGTEFVTAFLESLTRLGPRQDAWSKSESRQSSPA